MACSVKQCANIEILRNIMYNNHSKQRYAFLYARKIYPVTLDKVTQENVLRFFYFLWLHLILAPF